MNKETEMKLQEQKTHETHNLLSLLIEIHERMYPMMEYCERLQPIKLDVERNTEQFEYNGDYYKGDDTPITVDLTEDHEMYHDTKLFRLKHKEDMTSYDDQTSRSILKDLRGYIRHYNDVLGIDCEVYK